ncbi:MAG: hemerythrin domain-containing protein [Ahrensia sp.]
MHDPQKTDALHSRAYQSPKIVPLKREQVIPTLNQHLDVQAGLCDALEKFADRLPDAVTPDECLTLAQMVYPAVHRAHQFEENVLFPLLVQLGSNEGEMQKTLDRLHGEHWEDEAFAEELAQALREFALMADKRKTVDTLAYMIRGFFEGLRRHLAFEREHLMPILTAGSAR